MNAFLACDAGFAAGLSGRRGLLDGAGVLRHRGGGVPLGIGPVPQLLASIAPACCGRWRCCRRCCPSTPCSRTTPRRQSGADADRRLAPESWFWPRPCRLDRHGLPLCLAAPPLGFLLHLPVAAMPVLAASLLLGTPALSLFGTWGRRSPWGRVGHRAAGDDGAAVVRSGADFRRGGGGFGGFGVGGGGAADHLGRHGAGGAGDLSDRRGGGVAAGGGVEWRQGVRCSIRCGSGAARGPAGAVRRSVRARSAVRGAAGAALFAAGLVFALALSPPTISRGERADHVRARFPPPGWGCSSMSWSRFWAALAGRRPSAGLPRGARRRAAGRGLHLPVPGHRFVVGQADVGLRGGCGMRA